MIELFKQTRPHDADHLTRMLTNPVLDAVSRLTGDMPGIYRDCLAALADLVKEDGCSDEELEQKALEVGGTGFGCSSHCMVYPRQPPRPTPSFS